jgi:hypothetical protein
MPRVWQYMTAIALAVLLSPLFSTLVFAGDPVKHGIP